LIPHDGVAAARQECRSQVLELERGAIAVETFDVESNRAPPAVTPPAEWVAVRSVEGLDIFSPFGAGEAAPHDKGRPNRQ
jgi:hypothetical protein